MKKTVNGQNWELVAQNNKYDKCCDGCEASPLNTCHLFGECYLPDNLHKVWKLVNNEQNKANQ